jgi:hypothetical protein
VPGEPLYVIRNIFPQISAARVKRKSPRPIQTRLPFFLSVQHFLPLAAGPAAIREDQIVHISAHIQIRHVTYLLSYLVAFIVALFWSLRKSFLVVLYKLIVNFLYNLRITVRQSRSDGDAGMLSKLRKPVEFSAFFPTSLFIFSLALFRPLMV